ncbi:hypothetical protein ACRS9K_17770 [Burkholderia cenocepacia]
MPTATRQQQSHEIDPGGPPKPGHSIFICAEQLLRLTSVGRE